MDQQAKKLGEKYAGREPGLTETASMRRGLKTLFALAATWYRDVLHTAVGSVDSSGLGEATEAGGSSGVLNRPASLIANVGYAGQLAAVAGRTTPGRLIAIISQLADTESQLDANVNTKLCLDALVIRLARFTGGG